ncbi:hypothetical protein C1645_716080 [Glomus cerebriforme]|uniref:Uncharacterized protein n=1 Tax=Glomus cerebriforme TaxID=658196 RepID=A0A397SHC4_9GLOM|nr:hypothetical protein C1645_716080 [Glomus cerebriforme]
MQVSTSTRIATALIVAKFFSDILPTLAQAPDSSSQGFEAFISRRSVRNTWVAFWILWFIWSLVSFLHYSTRDTDRNNRGADGGERGDQTKTKKFRFGRDGNGAKRVANLARDLLLGLLSALVVNSISRGSAVAVEIITWFYLGVAIILLLIEALVDNKIIRLFFGVIEFGLLVAIFGLAYAHGWRMMAF